MNAHSISLDLAIRIAVAAHSGQEDKIGLPYILHPLAVMHAVETVDEKIVAVLHDAVEDSHNFSMDGTLYDTAEYIQTHIPKNAAEAIMLLTKQPGDVYKDYIQRICNNRLAAVVKQADVQHNMSRLHNLPGKDQERLAKKYRGALELLTEALR